VSPETSAGLSASDRLDLVELTARYAAAVDERDWAALAELFTPDAVLVAPDPPRSLLPVIESVGRDEIVAKVQPLSGFDRTFHHVTGTTWESDAAGAAVGRTTTVAHHVEGHGTDGLHSWAWHVIYADRCVRGAAGWLFERRALTLTMIEDRRLARVLPFADPPSR
jgi:hypothetical protein